MVNLGHCYQMSVYQLLKEERRMYQIRHELWRGRLDRFLVKTEAGQWKIPVEVHQP